MRESIRETCNKIAELDAAGVAIIVLRSESEVDIFSVAENYIHRNYRQVPLKNPTRDRKTTDELNMYEICGKDFREFGQISDNKIGNSLTNGNLIKELQLRINNPEPQMIFIHDLSDIIPGETDNSVRKEDQIIYINLLREISLAKRKGNNRTLIITASSEAVLPYKLSEYMFVIDIPYPKIPEIKLIITDVLQDILDVDFFEPPVQLLNELAEAFRGFRESAIRSTFEMAYASIENPLENQAATLFSRIVETKKQLLKKSGGLNWIEHDCDNIAGLDTLTQWINEQYLFFHNFAACSIHDEDLPKGVLVAGIPGTGKSLLAKNTAQILKIPLIKMDIGSLMGKYLGESEANVSRAIKLAEALSPCVLWIDELEKAFAGISDASENNQSIMRVFNSFLTWLQDRKKPCFVFATANNISKLPSEFLRKERFDDKFYVFMPTEQECFDIFTSHLLKKINTFETVRMISEHKNENKIKRESIFKEGAKEIITSVLKFCATKDKFLTGADIASIVKSAFRTLFTKHFMELTASDKTSAAGKRVIYYSISEIKDALLDEVKKTKTYGENIKQVCDYWLSLLGDNPFRVASNSPKSKYSILHTDFDNEKHEFKWDFLEYSSGLDYISKLKSLLEKAHVNESYDDSFALVLAIELKRRNEKS